RIVTPQLQAVRVVLAVLQCGVGVRALGAAQLDHDTVALLAGHGRNSSDIVTRAHAPARTKRSTVDIVAGARRKDKPNNAGAAPPSPRRTRPPSALRVASWPDAQGSEINSHIKMRKSS